jgi:integrase
MSEVKSNRTAPLRKTTTAKSAKPDKPYPDFPLFPHQTGRWAKKIRGKTCYFGPWSDPQAAVDKYNSQRDDLYAGRVPRDKTDERTIRDLLNRFLTAKQQLLDTGEIVNRTFTDYHATCAGIGTAFGLDRPTTDIGTEDFESLRGTLAKRLGPTALGNEVQRIRVVFKYAYDAGLIDKPLRFGPMFKRPSKKTLRKVRTGKGPRMFDAAQLRSIIAGASPALCAMVHLGINVGFGNTDVATLPLAAVDLKAGWVNYPRPKTGIERRARLWPETVAAIKAWLAKRPAPKSNADAHLLFLTKYRASWAKSGSTNPVSSEFCKVVRELKIHRAGLSFYALRHTFETIGGESLDQVAVDAIMGHAPAANDMASAYRERMTDERLKAVSDHVRRWLWPPASKKKASTKRTPATAKTKTTKATKRHRPK